MNKKRGVLLVEPDFPYPNKSKNKADSTHKNFIPIGLLKLGAYYRDKGYSVQLVRGCKGANELNVHPNLILVTSIFTYWSKYVWDTIAHYRNIFPKSEIHLGGIYATLHHDTPKFKGLARKYRVKINVGVHLEAEKHLPDYSLMPNVDYHATHMMRGCIRRCSFCGTWKIEPQRTNKSVAEVTKELTTIGKNKIIFYDNNLLANPSIKEILTALADLKVNGRPLFLESQSGFDGRLLEKDPILAQLIKQARFQNVRIAWDNSLDDKDSIKRQIDILKKVGYNAKDISVFMIYNFAVPYEGMLQKLEHCGRWGVQITDCRYRPLTLDYDNYNPHLRTGQPEGSFYVHTPADWSDSKIRSFRQKVRKHNIWIRYARDKGLEYDRNMEKWSAIHNLYKTFGLGRPPQLEVIEHNPRVNTRVKLLKKLATYHKKFEIPAPNLSNLSASKLDMFLKHLFEQRITQAHEDESMLKNIIQTFASNESLSRE